MRYRTDSAWHTAHRRQVLTLGVTNCRSAPGGGPGNCPMHKWARLLLLLHGTGCLVVTHQGDSENRPGGPQKRWAICKDFRRGPTRQQAAPCPTTAAGIGSEHREDVWTSIRSLLTGGPKTCTLQDWRITGDRMSPFFLPPLITAAVSPGCECRLPGATPPVRSRSRTMAVHRSSSAGTAGAGPGRCPWKSGGWTTGTGWTLATPA